MESRSSVTACIREIKRINSTFRKKKGLRGAAALKLMRSKDALIDEMAKLCDHPDVVATRGAKAVNMGTHRFPARRICRRCGHCESLGMLAKWKELAGTPSQLLKVSEYLVAEGLVLKKLGINL